ncbi:UNVERIFIED_ORG: hypothetical protein ABIB21_003072 [Arthrobacter sp. UYEF13]
MKQDRRWADSAGDDEAHPDAPASGVMVIRTWHDPWHPQGFRARITYGQTSESGQTTLATADPAEVLGVVKRWLAVQPGVSGQN